MIKKSVLGLFILLVAISINLALAEDSPSLHEVYQAAQSGKLAEAQKMMDTVLKVHPDSSKAHYVEAEILAKQGLLSKAEAELKNAERLEPGLPFAKPEAVEKLKEIIANSNNPNRSIGSISKPASEANFPWGILFIGIGSILVIFLFVRTMNARNPSNFPTNPQPIPQNTFGSPLPSYGSSGFSSITPTGGGLGSGIMGGLATGAAVGAGMVAGEAIAHHFMDGSHSSIVPPSVETDPWLKTPNDLGGTDFGIADNSTWNDSSDIADNQDFGGGDWN